MKCRNFSLAANNKDSLNSELSTFVLRSNQIFSWSVINGRHCCKCPPPPLPQTMLPHLPQRVLFLWKYFKILFGQLDWRQSLNTKIGPTLHEFDKAFKSVEPKPVIAVIGQVGHEDADLQTRKKMEASISTNKQMHLGPIACFLQLQNQHTMSKILRFLFFRLFRFDIYSHPSHRRKYSYK